MKGNLMEQSYIYFLYETDTDAVKIGKANDPMVRINQLTEDIDISNSYCISIDKDKALDIEKGIHRLLRTTQYHITDRVKNDGHTEWYHIDVIPKVKELLKLFYDITDFMDIPPLSTPGEKDILKKNYKTLGILAAWVESARKYSLATVMRNNGLFHLEIRMSDDYFEQYLDKSCGYATIGSCYSILYKGYPVNHPIVSSAYMDTRTKTGCAYLVDLRETVKQEHRLDKVLWNKFEALYEELEELCYTEEVMCSNADEAIEQSKKLQCEYEIKLCNYKEEFTAELALKAAYDKLKGTLPAGTINKYTDIAPMNIIDEKGVMCSWVKKYDGEGKFCGYDDFPFEDFGWQTREEQICLVLKLVESMHSDVTYAAELFKAAKLISYDV